MTSSHDALSADERRSPLEPDPADSPDLIDDPPSPDAPLDSIDEPVDLAWESDQADAVDQILEVGLDEDHDGPA